MGTNKLLPVFEKLWKQQKREFIFGSVDTTRESKQDIKVRHEFFIDNLLPGIIRRVIRTLTGNSVTRKKITTQIFFNSHFYFGAMTLDRPSSVLLTLNLS